MRHRLSACIIVLVLTGCTPGSPDGGLAQVGASARVCAERVDVGKAQAVVGRGVADLRQLSTFKPAERAGECALLDTDGGAELSVEVVRDAGGKALAEELKKLSGQTDYSGDDHSGVSGDARTTTALWAVDGDYYVRVLGLGGTSDEQREAALDLAQDVATRTAAIA